MLTKKVSEVYGCQSVSGSVPMNSGIYSELSKNRRKGTPERSSASENVQKRFVKYVHVS
jgi:hypothetical protein